MAYSKEKVNEVRKSYIFDRLPLERCADLHKVSPQTVRRWKKEAKQAGDDWEKVRAAHTLNELDESGREILTEFALEFKNTMQIVKEDKDLNSQQRVALLVGLADGFNKTVNSGKKLVPQVSQLAAALKTVKLFSEHIATHKPELLQEFIALLDSFGEVLEREFK